MTPSSLQFCESETPAERAARFREWLIVLLAQSVMTLRESLAARGVSQGQIDAATEDAREAAVQDFMKVMGQFRELNQPKSYGIVN